MASNFLLEIGDKIRLARKTRKMSQKELADLVNCSPQLISKIEKGQVDTTITTLNSIYRALAINADLKSINFYDDLEEWAKEVSMSSDIRWLYKQIEDHFPGFVEWKKRRAEGVTSKSGEPQSKVA